MFIMTLRLFNVSLSNKFGKIGLFDFFILFKRRRSKNHNSKSCNHIIVSGNSFV